MIDAFVFLITRSFKNRMKARLQRLKQPKYLIGAVLGVVYLSSYFIQFIFYRGKRGASQFTVDDSILPVLGVIALFLFTVSAWIFPHARAALAFTEAEVAFLFPAPVSRRMLIHYKLLRSQFAIFFTVLLLTLFTGRLLVDSQAWMRVFGWWVILSTLGLHFLGASFARTLLLERGISNWSRRLAVLAVLAALLTATILWARSHLTLPAFEKVTDWKAWLDYGRELLATPPLSYVMYPFRLVLAPFLASTPLEFFKAMPAALGLMALHYFWVIRSNVAFEEASLDLSRRIAERVAAAQQGRALNGKPAKSQRTPFRLAPVGFAPVAFLWKNLIQVQAALRARTLLIILIPLGVMGMIMAQSSSRSETLTGVASILLMMFFIWSLLLGPQLVRCDFRQDLNSMDVLKLFPLRGWQIVTGEILAPVVILTIVQWLLLIGILVMTLMTEAPVGLIQLPLSWLMAAALIAPFWNGLSLLIPNATVLLFPGWFQARTDAPQGIEVTGQRLLLFLGQIVLISVTVVPAGLVFALGFAPVFMAGAKNLAPLVGAAGAAVMFAAEIAGGVWLVGKLFDRFDLAAERGA
jgi:ABC-2 type transport system permease protein